MCLVRSTNKETCGSFVRLLVRVLRFSKYRIRPIARIAHGIAPDYSSCPSTSDCRPTSVIVMAYHSSKALIKTADNGDFAKKLHPQSQSQRQIE
ncbi:hypothetical protein AC249_AIPGENE6978 [Exaiptasia diaphana]|nr:hypothetical protein AC249_AIPGENE6978 [Exaiptasia diaphana]